MTAATCDVCMSKPGVFICRLCECWVCGALDCTDDPGCSYFGCDDPDCDDLVHASEADDDD
jgi:hypothetical protein